MPRTSADPLVWIVGLPGGRLDAENWLTIASLCALGAMSPGPSLAVVVRNTVQGGRGSGVATGLAHGVGIGLYAFAAVAGFAVVMATVPMLQGAIQLAGALYLAWMGIGALRGGSSDHGDEHQGRGMTEGFLVAFLNPKVALFFLAILSTVVPPEASLGTRVAVATLAMVIDGAWYAFAAVALSGSGAADWLSDRQQRLQQVTGVFLIGVALYMGLQLLG